MYTNDIMTLETAVGGTPIFTQNEGGMENIESGLSLETPEQAEARIAAMEGEIVEHDHEEEVETQSKIAEIPQSLGMPTEERTATPIEVAQTEQEFRAGDRVSLEQLLSVGDDIRNYSPEQRQESATAIQELERVRSFWGNEHPKVLEKIAQLNQTSRPGIMKGETLPYQNNTSAAPQADALPSEAAPVEVADSSDTLTPEQAPLTSTEAEDWRFRKLDQHELFVDRISAAHDLRSLNRYLAELGDITAPDGYVYKKEDTLRIIGFLKDSKDPNLQRVTNTYGLRDKVRKLLLQREVQ